MREKVSSMEEAEKELNRLRAVCVRLKKKQGEEIAFMLGLSVTDSQYIGRMGYQKSMRYGGKKAFICTEKHIHNGERVARPSSPKAGCSAASSTRCAVPPDMSATRTSRKSLRI